MRGKRARIGELVDGALRRWSLERGTREHRALLLWPELVGDEIARNTVAAAVRDRVLLVSATTHAWAQTLDMMKPQVLQRLRERLGEDVVRDIHFSAGRRPRRKGARRRAAPSRAPIALTEEEQAEVERAADRVTDPELRRHAARAFASLVAARRRFQEQGYRTCDRCGGVFRGKGRRCAACAARGQGRKGR